MIIYPQNQYIPYTYLIGWSEHNIWYYGSEYSSKGKIANPNNLWNVYFTSSKHVKHFRQRYGEPDIKEIRKTFKDEQSTRIWEHKVLKRINASKEEKWLNKSDGSLNSLDSKERSKISTERMADPEIKDRILKKQKETMNTTEYKQKRKQIAKNLWNNTEFREKTIKARNTPEARKRNSDSQKEAQNRPEVRAKKSKSGKEAQNRPDVREKRINSLKAVWNKPDFRDKIKESNKKRPVFHCQCCDRDIKGESNWTQHLRSKMHLDNLP